MSFISINPYTEEKFNEISFMSEDEMNLVLQRADAAFNTWRQSSFQEREHLLLGLANSLENNIDSMALLATREMGKPITQAIAEIEKCAWLCKFYAENGQAFLEDKSYESSAEKSFISYEPLGIIYGIMPWNFPYWQFFRFAIPAIMAGNVCLLKHAPNVGLCALEIAKVFDENHAGSIFQNVFIDYDFSDKLIADKRIKAISLTGSERAGAAVASKAGKHIKKCVLELGGSDPYIITPTADIEQAVNQALTSRFQNNGQSCIAAKRFIVYASIYDDFIEAFEKGMNDKYKPGNPEEESINLGPLARKDLMQSLNDQIKDAESHGAHLRYSSSDFPENGFFSKPVIIENIHRNMRLYAEESFGPAASFYRYEKEEIMLHLANDTAYGLGASVWSEDTHEALRIGKQIQSGTVSINGMVKSDPRLPFGGVKQSGYGREMSDLGIREFTNIKTYNIFNGR